jgi:hypothetical protein
MRKIDIPKKSGGFRTIYMPNEEEKIALRAQLPFLHELQEKVCDKSIVHGFFKNRNIVTNAIPHIGYKYTTCFDIKDFFDSISLWDFGKILYIEPRNSAQDIQAWIDDIEDKYGFMFINGRARQGLPTSPLLANIVASSLDREINQGLEDVIRPLRIVYTRYADDLAFSYDDPEIRHTLLSIIPDIIYQNRFRLNSKKTRTMSASKGRRIICGVAVGDTDIYPPRKIKRKLRAAIHNKRKKSINGFKEYCKLKLPRNLSFESFEIWKGNLLDKIRFKITARNSKISTGKSFIAREGESHEG